MQFFGLDKFENQQEKEKLIGLIRRSKIGYFFATFSNLFMFLIGGAVVYLGWIWLIYGDLKFHLIEFIILAVYIFLILFLWFYFRYATYLLVTTHRIEKHWVTYLLGNKREILWYHEINKISYSYPSIIAKLFDYGTIEIMAGDTEKVNIIFEMAPNPEGRANKLRTLKKQHTERIS